MFLRVLRKTWYWNFKVNEKLLNPTLSNCKFSSADSCIHAHINLKRYRLWMQTLQALGWTSFCTTWLPLQRNGISSPAKFCCCLSDRTFHILGNSSVQEWEARSELAWDSWHTAARKETVLVSWHMSKNLECRANSCCTVCCENKTGWKVIRAVKRRGFGLQGEIGHKFSSMKEIYHKKVINKHD